MSVTLRIFDRKSGKKAIYLDTYPPIEGKRFENTGLHLLPDVYGNKQANARTMAAANTILHKRLAEYAEYMATGKKPSSLQRETARHGCNVARFIQDMANTHGLTKSKRDSMMALAKKFGEYAKDMQLHSLDAKTVKGFEAFLKASKSRQGGLLSKNTVAAYMSMLGTALAEAADHSLCQPIAVTLPEFDRKPAKYISEDDLHALLDTPWEGKTRDMAVMSLYTGLRYSDIVKLKRRDLVINGGTAYLMVTAQKTGKSSILPISDDCRTHFMICLARYGDEPFAQSYFLTSTTLKKWTEAAGLLPKGYTFHTFRHTNMALMQQAGVDAFTASKMLMHKSISSTERYYKEMDSLKVGAANAVKLPIPPAEEKQEGNP